MQVLTYSLALRQRKLKPPSISSSRVRDLWENIHNGIKEWLENWLNNLRLISYFSVSYSSLVKVFFHHYPWIFSLVAEFLPSAVPPTLEVEHYFLLLRVTEGDFRIYLIYQ